MHSWGSFPCLEAVKQLGEIKLIRKKEKIQKMKGMSQSPYMLNCRYRTVWSCWRQWMWNYFIIYAFLCLHVSVCQRMDVQGWNVSEEQHFVLTWSLTRDHDNASTGSVLSGIMIFICTPFVLTLAQSSEWWNEYFMVLQTSGLLLHIPLKWLDSEGVDSRKIF